MNCSRFAFPALAMAAVVLSGCQSEPIAEAQEAASPTVESSMHESAQPEVVDACTLVTGAEISAAFGLESLGPSTLSGTDPTGARYSTCSWAFPAGGQETADVESARQLTENVTVELNLYDDSIGSVGTDTYQRSGPQVLIDSYYAAALNPAPGNSSPERLSDLALGAVRSNGSVTVAIDEESWADVTVWQCKSEACHSGVVAIARMLADAKAGR